MKRILIPIDFSFDAFDGLAYAIKLAEYTDAELVLFHVNSDQKRISEIQKSKKKDVAFKVLSHLALEKIGNTLAYQIKIKTGEIVASILEESESEIYDLVIMGTRDNYTILDKWIGTVSLGVSKKCKTPLLLIPQGTSFHSYERILVASDYHINRKGVLDFIAEWNLPFMAITKFLHVKTSEKDSFLEESSLIIQKYYQTRQVEFPFEIEIKHGIDTPAVIYQTAIQENMDLLILTTEKKSSLNSLLLKSVSQELIIRSVKPILLLQPNGQKITK